MHPILAGVRAAVESFALFVLMLVVGAFYVGIHVLPCRYAELRERRQE